MQTETSDTWKISALGLDILTKSVVIFLLFELERVTDNLKLIIHLNEISELVFCHFSGSGTYCVVIYCRFSTVLYTDSDLFVA